MSALVYILRKSLKNTIKGLIRKPAPLIAYIIIAGFIIAPSIFSGPTNQEAAVLKIDMELAKLFLQVTPYFY